MSGPVPHCSNDREAVAELVFIEHFKAILFTRHSLNGRHRGTHLVSDEFQLTVLTLHISKKTLLLMKLKGQIKQDYKGTDTVPHHSLI